MNKLTSKLVAGMLAASIMLVPLTSCKKKGGSDKSHSGDKITSDTPWFDSKVIDISPEIDQSKKLQYAYSQLAGTDDKYIAVYTSGSYEYPTGNIDWETFDYTEYQFETLTVIDRNTGEIVNTMDMESFMKDGEYVNGATYVDGKLTINSTTWDDTTYEMMNAEHVIDPMTGEEIEYSEIEGDGSIYASFKVGDYRVDLSSVWDDATSMSSVQVIVHKPDGTVTPVDIKEPGKDIYSSSAIFPISENKIMVPADTNNGTNYYEIDLETCELTKTKDEEYNWLNSLSIYNATIGSDGYVYTTTPVGISKIDMQKKTTEELFNFSWCGVSRNILTNMQIASVEEDSFLLCGSVYHNEGFSNIYSSGEEFKVILFSKADKNPHAGKTILELYASYGYVEETVGDAIMKFNETNGKYFIEVTDRYTVEIGNAYNDINSDDELSTISDKYSADMSNQLAMDIINGDGPDIFMDVSYYGQLNNDNYLADLSPYVKDLDSDKYFTNVFECSKVDGKLYNIPISFTIEGIQTDAKYAGKSGVGFTTEEYVDFLDTALNGEDIITSGQAHYFTQLFGAMSDQFIKNGKADFSGEDFAALAKYVKDNVRESSLSWDEQDGGGMIVTYDPMNMNSEPQTAINSSVYGFYGYFSNINELNGANAILGLPSSDGRGPMLGAYTSVAISAQAYDVDACAEFVKMLLSDEVQEELGKSGSFTLNREVFEEVGHEAVDYFNENPIDGMYYYGYPEAPQNRVEFTYEQVEDLERTIESCSKMNTQDASINVVLVEEMPAYFSGQKELDEVVKIAQDRVQKVLDERK
ncbi:MAG: extracellular solute-binding protein [Clostridiales bacterium]|nr:extracellular solute-binding protein [Clostridiales bacterium]